MEYEIIKTEGVGRIGHVFGNPEFTTPSFLCPFAFDMKQGNSILHDNLNNFFESPDKKTSVFSFNNEYINTFFQPSIIAYPSLQMQGKSISNITSYEELFPVHYTSEQLNDNIFHLIPLDLPLVNLGKYNIYLESLFNLEINEYKSRINLVLNIPCLPELFEQELPPNNIPEIKIISLGDISSLLNHPLLLLKYLKLIRSWTPSNTMLYAPGIPSSYFPILVYLGIDLFDLSYLNIISSNPDQRTQNILEHNITKNKFIEKLVQTREALEIGKLRDLTRIHANSFPPMKSLLRISDKKGILSECTPFFSSRSLYCTDETDFTRPEVLKFRTRLKTNFTFPSHYKGIIFLPCSAKKPYSTSKSHMLFRNTIRRNLKKKRHLIGEVILTSPLGIVPRDLEYTYPAAHYDIPVTGEWQEIERNHLKEDLVCFIEKIKPSIPLLGFIGGVEQEVLKEVCNDKNRAIHFISSEYSRSLTSRNSLLELGKLLREVFEEISSNSKHSPQLTFLRTIADYQFGNETGSILFPDDVRISGHKELGLRVRHNNKHLATFRPSNGLLSISLEAGKRLLHHTKNIVTYEGTYISGSTIFAKGIIAANPEISPNEEVLVIDPKGNLLAIGTTYLSGNYLVNMKRGKGIKIRQKVKQNSI